MRSTAPIAMMGSMSKPTVAIVGAGVAGLALGNFLLRSGVPCVIYEKHTREYVEQRQRAGVIDSRAVRMFREWGLEERVVGGVPTKPALNFRVDGRTRTLELDPNDHGDGRFCPQRVLVQNLMNVFIADGGDLRFGAEVELPSLDAELIAGCDGDRGITRAAIPPGRLKRYAHEYGYAWLTILAEVPPNHQGMMAIHARGFAGQFARGPRASRFYLQVPLTATTADWPADRIWSELEARFEEPMTERGRIISTQVVPIRSVVHSPMNDGRIHLLGDAAHIIPPMSAKGMNLALHDADVFAKAVVRGELDTYSATCLKHVWKYQAFAAWWTELIHDAGDGSLHGDFRHHLARADFERLFESAAANRLLSEFLSGLA